MCRLRVSCIKISIISIFLFLSSSLPLFSSSFFKSSLLNSSNNSTNHFCIIRFSLAGHDRVPCIMYYVFLSYRLLGLWFSWWLLCILVSCLQFCVKYQFQVFTFSKSELGYCKFGYKYNVIYIFPHFCVLYFCFFFFSFLT